MMNRPGIRKVSGLAPVYCPFCRIREREEFPMNKLNQGRCTGVWVMTRRREVSPELLDVYASLVFFIGSLITLAASIISYRQNGRRRLPESPEAAGSGMTSFIR